MNHPVNYESVYQPISKKDAEIIVADLNKAQYNKSFSHLHIALKFIKQNLDPNHLPTVELPNIDLDQEIEEDAFYVHRQKYTINRSGQKIDVHTLLAYVCHKDEDYLITVAREHDAHDPNNGFSDEYPIYNACLKDLFKAVGVFCHTHNIKENRIIFNSFFFKKLLEERYPETKNCLNQNYDFFTSFVLSNANNIVSNKGHFIAKQYLRHYKAIHDKHIVTHTFNINSGILHHLLESYTSNDVMAGSFKEYWCDFLNKRHQHRIVASTHPFPPQTINELMLTAKKGQDLYRKIAHYISPHILIHGKVVHLEIMKATGYIETWFKMNGDKKPTIEDLAKYIYKCLEKAYSLPKTEKKLPHRKSSSKTNLAKTNTSQGSDSKIFKKAKPNGNKAQNSNKASTSNKPSNGNKKQGNTKKRA